MGNTKIRQMGRRIDTFAAHSEERSKIGSSINTIAAYAERTGYQLEMIKAERKKSKLI